MSTLYSTGQVATRIGRAVSSVRRAAARLGIGMATPRGLLLSEADISQIAAEIKGIGCPKFVSGNDLWQSRKNVGKSARKRR